MRFILYILIFVCCSFIAHGKASENTQIVMGDFAAARMKNMGTAQVETIIDAQTVLMRDGRVIRLLGIDYPENRNGNADDILFTAKNALEQKLPKGTDVLVWQSLNNKSGRINRMGHNLAHLEVKKTKEWVNGAMVADGLAWVMTDKSNPDMVQDLYALEQSARDGAKGLWGKDSPYGLILSDNAAKGDGQFRIVEGVVTKAAASKNNIFLNFRNDSKKDSTVMISPTLRKVFARQGIDVLGLSGQKIRVRGWIRMWNGPFMELETAERLEVLAPVIASETKQSSPAP